MNQMHAQYSKEFTSHLVSGISNELCNEQMRQPRVEIKRMWQSRIEIEYYSVAYFECITKFDAL